MSSNAPTERYDQLFPDDATKAKAFDELAARYYSQNFSTFPKAEVDLLMFSLYLNQAYRLDERALSHSDYNLSKELGITQNKVRSLKERKELKYPSAFDWKTAFNEILDRAEYRDEKIRIYLQDGRLYTELANVLQERGNYAETTLTRGLLVVSPLAFVDLMMQASSGDVDEAAMREQLAKVLRDNALDADAYVKGSVSLQRLARESTPDVIEAIVVEGLKMIPCYGSIASTAIEHLIDLIHNGMKEKKRRNST